MKKQILGAFLAMLVVVCMGTVYRQISLLRQLDDVALPASPTDAHVLTYNSTLGKWTNSAVVASGSIANSAGLGTNTTIYGLVVNTALTNNAALIGDSAHFTNAVTYAWETLSYSGTNVTITLTNSTLFTLSYTGNVYFPQPSGFPASGRGHAFTVEIIGNGTGGYTSGFDTNYWKFSSNSVPTLSTNANAVTILSCVTDSGGTNVYATASLRHR